MENTRNRVISALVEHKPGVLHSISNMFRRRGFNIESIAVGPAEKSGFARMTIIVKVDEKTAEQVVKQLNKLIDVVKVTQLDPSKTVTRELILIKVNVPDTKTRSDIINCVEVFRGHVIDVSPKTLTVELTGDPDKTNAFLDLMRSYGIVEIARTGLAALSRGSQAIRIEQ
ncbi:acetolactate synthase small subunit [Candidatus Bathyarchaeota archaeon]|nr:acetolactate synthase small subunit [Candidatus Bathyarchaeota archaeon]